LDLAAFSLLQLTLGQSHHGLRFIALFFHVNLLSICYLPYEIETIYLLLPVTSTDVNLSGSWHWFRAVPDGRGPNCNVWSNFRQVIESTLCIAKLFLYIKLYILEWKYLFSL
jgi:hypothetical protein